MKRASEVSAELFRARELAAFGVVGAAAFAVHFAVVATLVPLGLAPLIANVVAFVIAFSVSFSGHSRWSFPSQRRTAGRALRRFAVVAIAGFLVNESAYALLLAWTSLDYRVALFIVLVGVAGSTWLAGKFWAFADD